jgi:hypothetical protein
MSALVANDDLLLMSILTFSLLYLWDSLSRTDSQSSNATQAVHQESIETISTPQVAAKSVSVPVHEVKEENAEQVAASPQSVAITPTGSRNVVLPYLPGCEPDGAAAKEMIAKYPDASIEDIVRYLVARKGNVPAASEMLEKCRVWRGKNFPLKRDIISVVYGTNCMFYHGTARDGTPVIYFRGGLYDKNKAAPELFVLGAAHCIDTALSLCNTINVTVLVYTGHAEGGPNAPADMNFIKAFVAVLSDNYPERLKRLILYPFPWWGRTIWSVASMFVDKRTQEKVVLLPGDGTNTPPKELYDYVDPREIPAVCGGVDKRPLVNMMDTIKH